MGGMLGADRPLRTWKPREPVPQHLGGQGASQAANTELAHLGLIESKTTGNNKSSPASLTSRSPG